MADYTGYKGISPEMAALLPHIPAISDTSVEALKQSQNAQREAIVRKQMEMLADKVVIKNHSIPARDGVQLEARSYRSAAKSADEPLPVFLYFHGGGFLLGTIDTEDATCSRIAIEVDCVVLNVNYRHTPEWTFPTAWNDSEDGYEWCIANAASAFHGDATKLVIGGISAGAQLTASLVQTKKREGAAAYANIKGQVLMIPALVDEPRREKLFAEKLHDPKLSSWVENEHAPLLPVSRIQLFVKLLEPKDGDASLDDRRVSPGAASVEEIRGLPPAAFGIAGLDPLRDEALLYSEYLAENGIPTKTHLFKGVPHGYRRFGDMLASASKHWDTVLADGIKWALSSPAAESKPKVVVHE